MTMLVREDFDGGLNPSEDIISSPVEQGRISMTEKAYKAKSTRLVWKSRNKSNSIIATINSPILD